MLDANNELPGNFLHELYKWALECMYCVYIHNVVTAIKFVWGIQKKEK